MSEAAGGMLILIIEDNDKNMRLARDVLQFHGFRTLEATTGEDGIALACKRLPNLILMDVELPGIDGVSAAEQLKANASTAAIPIVALTASVTRDDRDRFHATGFAGCIAKPIDVLAFPAQVLSHCAGAPTRP